MPLHILQYMLMFCMIEISSNVAVVGELYVGKTIDITFNDLKPVLEFKADYWKLLTSKSRFQPSSSQRYVDILHVVC